MLNSPVSVVIGLVHVLVPFMVLSIASVLQGINPRLEESARDARRRPACALSGDHVAAEPRRHRHRRDSGLHGANGSFVTLLLLGGGRCRHCRS